MSIRGIRGIIVFTLTLTILLGPLNGIDGASTSGGGYTTFIKADYVAGNTTDSRISGGQWPAASFGSNTTTYCGRLGILEPIKCLTGGGEAGNTTFSGGPSCGGIDDFRIVSNKVGLRRLNWLKRGVALNIGLPDE